VQYYSFTDRSPFKVHGRPAKMYLAASLGT
jgi:hypothetical protein